MNWIDQSRTTSITSFTRSYSFRDVSSQAEPLSRRVGRGGGAGQQFDVSISTFASVCSGLLDGSRADGKAGNGKSSFTSRAIRISSEYRLYRLVESFGSRFSTTLPVEGK
jgi:hypothetical protein